MKKAPSEPGIWAIILAAGESKRMGEPKLLLRLAGRTIIETVVEQALASRAGQTIVVLGAGRGLMEAQISRFPVEIVFNPDFKTGMLSSVIRGLGRLPDSARAAVILLADQPFVSSGHIDAVIAAYIESQRGIVLPVCHGRRGHPLLLDLKYRGEIKGLSRRVGLRDLLRRHADDILEVPADDPAVLRDIDDRGDYLRARSSPLPGKKGRNPQGVRLKKR